jgi:cell shape-determining protein MreC
MFYNLEQDTHMTLDMVQDELSKLKEQYMSLQSHCSYMEVKHENELTKADNENRELLEKMTLLVRRNQTLSSELDMR